MSAYETARLRKLYQMELLDTPAEKDFDEIVQLASQLAHTPISLITLLDTDRQWFKAKVGLTLTDTDRPSAVCNYTIQGDTLFEVEDLAADKRFEQNKLVRNGLKIRYYAGMPLITSDGYKLGALCVIDTKSRNKLSEDQAFALRVLARQAMTQIELRVKNKELDSVRMIADKLITAVSMDADTAVKTLGSRISQLESGRATDEVNAGLKALQHSLSSASRSFSNIISWGKLQSRIAAAGLEKGTPVLRALEHYIQAHAADIALKANRIVLEVDGQATLPIPQEAFLFVVDSLLENANRFTSDGELKLRYFASGGSPNGSPRHYLCFSDTGIGIPEAYVAGYADTGTIPVRPDTDGRVGHGHGIMLVRQVLQYYGGKLHIESSSGNHCNMIVII